MCKIMMCGSDCLARSTKACDVTSIPAFALVRFGVVFKAGKYECVLAIQGYYAKRAALQDSGNSDWLHVLAHIAQAVLPRSVAHIIQSLL